MELFNAVIKVNITFKQVIKVCKNVPFYPVQFSLLFFDSFNYKYVVRITTPSINISI